MADPVSVMAGVSAAMTIAGMAAKWGKALKDWIKKKKKGETVEESPIVFSDDDVTVLNRLDPQLKEALENYVGYINQNPDAFLGSLDEIDKEGLLAVADQKFPNAEELGFPGSSQQVISDLMEQTEFAPQEEYARKQFEERTIPGIAERFAGMGALKSSAFQGQLGEAASDLESRLGALRSGYNLQRANVLGPLQQKQQA